MLLSVVLLFAQVTETTAQDFKDGYSGLIITGLFFLALFVAAIWWLRR